MAMLKEVRTGSPARIGATVHVDPIENMRTKPARVPRAGISASSLFMSDSIEGLNVGAHFLDRLSPRQRARVESAGRRRVVKRGDSVFMQGEYHDGIFIIQRGAVRVFYAAPSGREITLAYWTAGHFIGGPEIAGGGVHMWSGTAIEDCEIKALSGAATERLLAEMPEFALALIDGLIAKGKCYSSMAQMLGTRSVIERLAQYLLNLSALHGAQEGSAVVIKRKLTHDQIAAMIGSTRQWVTIMLKRFKAERILAIDGNFIRIRRIDLLKKIVFKD